MAGFNLSADSTNIVGGVDLNDYPILDDKEVGQLRWFYKVTSADISDFSLIPSGNLYGVPKTASLQGSISAYRYTIAFATYFFALEQYHKLSANVSILGPMYDRMIQKMLDKQVWGYWSRLSKGMPPLEPQMNTPYPQDDDPVDSKNIMYSGHLSEMIALYEKLYQDMKYSQPNSIVFTVSDRESYSYNLQKLQDVILNQFQNMPQHCCQCQPNACFPVCNQHPILGHLVFDQVHGTNYYRQAAPLLKEWFDSHNFTDSQTGQVAVMQLIKQNTILRSGPGGADLKNPIGMMMQPLAQMNLIHLHSAAIDGWNGAFMNAWYPDYVNTYYPAQKAANIASDSGFTKVGQQGIYDQIAAPFFAALVAEMGDTAVRDGLLTWFDKEYKTQWGSDLSYSYPPGNEIPVRFPNINNIFGTNTPYIDAKYTGMSFTGSLAALARANKNNGLSDLHNKPSTVSLTSPMVTKIDFPRAALTRAIYDASKRALVVSTAVGFGSSTLTLGNLPSNSTWQLYIDGTPTERVGGQTSVYVTLDFTQKHDLLLLRLS